MGNRGAGHALRARSPVVLGIKWEVLLPLWGKTQLFLRTWQSKRTKERRALGIQGRY